MATPSTANSSGRNFTVTYLDTSDRRLARAGIPLRRRVEHGKSVWEARIADSTISALGGPAQPPRELQRVLAALLQDRELVQVARLRSSDDDVALLDGQRVLATYGGLEDALAVALEAPARTSTPPKTAPAVEHVRAYLRTQLMEIERHDPAVRVGSGPEHLHDLRVAIRRTRAALREARPLLGEEQTRALRDELKWLGQQLGHARDLDVLLAGLQRDVAELDGADAVPAGKIVAQVRAAREAVQGEVLATLESERYLNLLGALTELVDAPPVASSEFSLSACAKREYRKLERQIGRLGPEPADDALHAARIQAKRARYATELAGHALGKDGRRLIAAAKAFQDVVGAHQDAVVAETQIRTAVRRSRGVGSGLAAGRLIEQQRARRRAARTAFRPAWERVRKRARAVGLV